MPKHYSGSTSAAPALTKIDYGRAFYFVVGTIFGCGAHEVLERLLNF